MILSGRSGFSSLLILASCLLSLLIPLPLHAQCLLKVRVNNAPPHYYMADHGWQGIAVDILQALLNEADCQADYYLLPWQRGLMELEKGTIDIMLNVGYNEERAEHFYYLSPETYEQQVLVVRKDARQTLQTLDDLTTLPMQVAFEKGVIFAAPFTEKLQHDKVFRQHVMPSAVETHLESLFMNRLSGVITTLDFATYALKNNPKYGQALRIDALEISSLPTFFALSKKSVSRDRLHALQEANIRLIAKGKYKEILSRWRRLE